MPRPQYVFGTMSPKPTLRNVIAISHMEFKRFACSSSWNLYLCFIREESHISFIRCVFWPSWFLTMSLNIFHTYEHIYYLDICRIQMNGVVNWSMWRVYLENVRNNHRIWFTYIDVVWPNKMMSSININFYWYSLSYILILFILSSFSFLFFFLHFICLLLTTMPHVRVMPRPQYVFGTMSPYPTHKNVMAVSHMAFSKFECSSSWNLHRSNNRHREV